ncbi:MAG: F0F1 ATP synthase subunit B [Coriobacteriales bacterium]|jgi:F-type H+-transporting ATPase subunit b|nr:F0F1 ATP synthase subunit B [Coriobacteriales bacterium]
MTNKIKKITTRVGFAACTAVCSFSFLPTLAFADEGGASSQLGLGMLIPTLGEFLPMLIAFIVLLIVLGKFGWPAFIGMIDKRRDTIKSQLEEAEKAKLEAEGLLKQAQDNLADTQKQAAEIIAQAKQTAEKAKAEIAQQATAEAERIKQTAEQAMATERAAAVAELQANAAAFAVLVAGKLINKDLSDADHLKIVQQYVKEAGDLRG